MRDADERPQQRKGGPAGCGRDAGCAGSAGSAASQIRQLDFRTSNGRACVGWIANDTKQFFSFRLLAVFVYYLPHTFRKSFSTVVLLIIFLFRRFNFCLVFKRRSDFTSRRQPHKFESGFSRVEHLLGTSQYQRIKHHQNGEEDLRRECR